MERNPEFQTVKDAGADEVAEANVDKITMTRTRTRARRSPASTRTQSISWSTHPRRPLAEVKTRYADRFRMEESINTYYFWMNTERLRSTT